MRTEQSHSNSGIGILDVLGIVFIVLKLCKVIAWPWIWVLSPFWITIIIFIVVVTVTLIKSYRY